MKRVFVMGLSALLACACRADRAPAGSLEPKIAAAHAVATSDAWGGGHRIVFEFDGRRAWVVEPERPRADRPWIWTMQWMGAYLNRSGIPELMKRGFYHVHLEAFDTKADDAGVEALSRFQDYLVKELGFAPKARLLGMSWGGFYSVRYAHAHPERVACVMLDAPLLNFTSFAETRQRELGSWARTPPPGGDWSSDPRMPVNMAADLAKAGIPFHLLYGGQDAIVDPAINAELFAARFKAAGGVITVERRDMYGHHPHGFEHEDLGRAVDFYDGPQAR